MTINLKSRKMIRKFSLLPLFIILILSAKAQTLESRLAPWINIVVSQDGTGTTTTVQQAIDMIPDHNTERKIIFIRNGIYKEKILVPATKTHITLIGESAEGVVLIWDDFSGRVVKGDTITTSTSYSFAVDAHDFTSMNLTFENAAGPVGQAVALRTHGDRHVFFHVRLVGHQDTYYSRGPYRNYLKDCYIEGTTDYIFGRSTVVFDSCVVHSLKTGSFITAASTEPDTNFGYAFFNSRFTAGPGIERVFLGRPWRPYAKTVIINSFLDDFVNPQGWSIWRGNENHLTCYYAEYGNHGPGAVTLNRIEWAHQLSSEEVAIYTLKNIFSQKANPKNLVSDWVPELESDSVYLLVKYHTHRLIDGK
jgi:pectinesterase